MPFGFAIMTGISAGWFIMEASLAGWFGIGPQRFQMHPFKDKAESARLLRVLERYENGEFTVQLSKYNDNLLFTKVIQNGAVSYDAQRIYVQIDQPDHYCFGWLADEPLHVAHYKQNKNNVRNGRKAISTEAWKKLMKIRSMLKEDNEKDVQHGFFKRKHKNEEVHLS
jgi:hypothetical protein